MGTQKQDWQKAAIWCPVLSHGLDGCVRSWRAWFYLSVTTSSLGPVAERSKAFFSGAGSGSREAPNSPLLQNPCFLKLQSVQLCPAPLGPCCGNCADSILWPCVQESLRARLRPWNTSWSAGPKRRGGHFPGKRRSKQPSANSSNNRAIEMHSLVADGTSGAGAVAGSGLG